MQMSIDRIFSVFNTAASGLSAQRQQMEVTAKNIANVDTLDTPEGGPYRKRGVNMSAKETTWFSRFLQREISRFGPLGERMLFGGAQKTSGVEAKEYIDAADMGQLVYDPGHPMANADGYVLKPNINVIQEMVTMISATRAYEANLSIIQSAKDMHKRALEI
jgi:flagellar basal-body rod protein FlgC